MAEDEKSDQGGMRSQSVVSISLPLADVHTLYLLVHRLQEHVDSHEFIEPNELHGLLQMMTDILPPAEMLNGIYNHMRKGHHGATPRYTHTWEV